MAKKKLREAPTLPPVQLKSSSANAVNRPLPRNPIAAIPLTSDNIKKPCEKREQGRVQLVFLGTQLAQQVGTRSGPNLRVCIRPDAPGLLYPVKTTGEALSLYKSAQNCAQHKDPEAFKACVLPGGKPGLGRGGRGGR